MSNHCHCCQGSGLEQDDRVLGQNLKKKRLAAGLTGVQMARALHISTSFLCQLEAGHRTWQPELVTAYHNVLAAKPASVPLFSYKHPR